MRGKTDYDNQQQMVYTAERSVDWGAFGGKEMLGDLEDVWEFVTRLTRRQSFAKRYPRLHRRQGTIKMRPMRYTPYGRHVYVKGYSLDTGRSMGIKFTPRASGGCANDDEISLSKWARQKYVVLHELAHAVDYSENGSPDYMWHQGHGWQWCAIYLNLVGMALGADAKKALRQAFKDNNVKYLRPQGAKNQCPWDPRPDRAWHT